MYQETYVTMSLGVWITSLAVPLAGAAVLVFLLAKSSAKVAGLEGKYEELNRNHLENTGWEDEALWWREIADKKLNLQAVADWAPDKPMNVSNVHFLVPKPHSEADESEPDPSVPETHT